MFQCTDFVERGWLAGQGGECAGGEDEVLELQFLEQTRSVATVRLGDPAERGGGGEDQTLPWQGSRPGFQRPRHNLGVGVGERYRSPITQI
jgi:hypothetical protein